MIMISTLSVRNSPGLISIDLYYKKNSVGKIIKRSFQNGFPLFVVNERTTFTKLLRFTEFFKPDSTVSHHCDEVCLSGAKLWPIKTL